MDYQIFKLLNGLAGQNVYLDYFFIFLGRFLIFLLVLLALFFIFVIVKKLNQRRLLLWRLIYGGALAYVFNWLVGLIFFRSRPFVTHQVNQLIEKSAVEKSFPSDHATLAFLIAATIFLVNRRWGWFAIGLAVLVTLGRVIVGVHYPLDVLAGAAVGIFFAGLVKKFSPKALK